MPPNPEVEDVRARNPIVDVVGRYVTWDMKKSQPSKNHYWACCPFHGEKSPSFNVLGNKGIYHCFGCGASGDVFKFIEQYNNVGFHEAFKFLGGVNRELTPDEKRAYAVRQKQLEADRKVAEVQAAKDREHKIGDAVDLWRSCKPFGETINETLAERYLIQRGIPPIYWPPSLRFHGSLDHKASRTQRPALVAAVTGLDRKIRSVWRIYLDNDGTNFVYKGDKQKLGFGPAAGGTVKLTPQGPDGNIGEGLESTLAAMVINKCVGGWESGLSTSGISGAEIYDRAVTRDVWSDGDRYSIDKKTGEIRDPAGQSAAIKYRDRCLGMNVKSVINEPPEGMDWLDVLEAQNGA